MVLSHIIFPKTKEHPEELYYRAVGQVQYKEDKFCLASQSRVRFNTYFNAFYYPKYCKYSHITEICLCVTITGEAWARIIYGGTTEETVLSETRLNGDGNPVNLPSCNLETLPKEGMIFLEIEAISKDVCFWNGCYETEKLPCNVVKVAAVICTFRREEYVLKNLQRLQQEIWNDGECQIRENLDVFIVDNGRTIKWKETPHVQVFPNRNYGGSGGFTRGLIEAYRRRDEYTHVLFMDDDISFETEAIFKTIQLLKYAKKTDQPLCIGGQMLREKFPTVQYEAGAAFRAGSLCAFHRDIDLSQEKNLLENEKEMCAQYNAWWYCCIPLSVVETKGLPLPFFIKGDDVEYGLRLKPHILLMNGIGVWHMDFSDKYSSHLEYYIKRNELVVSALYQEGNGIWRSLYKLLRRSAKAILLNDPKTIDFLFQAYRDFLAGPDFFLSAEEEELNNMLLEENKKPAQRGLFRTVFLYPFRFLSLWVQFLISYPQVCKEYRQRLSELTSLDFWCRHLGIELPE